MMIAAPPPLWPSLSGLATAELVGLLHELAANVPVHRMLREPPRAEEEEDAGDVGANDPAYVHQESCWARPAAPAHPTSPRPSQNDAGQGVRASHRICIFTGVEGNHPTSQSVAFQPGYRW